MELVNLSRFAAQRTVVMDRMAEETLVVVVKATFAIAEGTTDLQPKQEPVALADAHFGAPGVSGIAYASDLAILKSATDVVLLGSAYTRDPRHSQVDVTLGVGERRKTVRVFGNRTWQRRLGMFVRASDPTPFERLPLRWEFAYGGTDPSPKDGPERCAHNPIGVGFRGRHSKLPAVDQSLPNLEFPEHPLRAPDDSPPPAGFGFIAPHWQPRLSWAGTYDEAWRKGLAPLLPNDFDARFHQVAPEDQIFPGELAAGTPIEVHNADPSGLISFALPGLRPAVEVRLGDELTELAMVRDTVVIDAENKRLLVVWRGSLPVHARVYDIAWIRIAEDAGT